MMHTAALRSDSDRRLDPSVVRVGKDVVELVTSGMYLSPVTIYREYVQNAADAVEAAVGAGLIKVGQGRVDIQIDHRVRSVRIVDNGIGIPAVDAAAILLAIGGSTKRGTKARGFRGIGRLSGLAYCKTLRFRTRRAGENVISIVEWDCRQLRQRLADDRFEGGLEAVVTQSVTLGHAAASDEDPAHFFEVVMLDVARHRGDILLNEATIGGYLAQTAPVRFRDDFSHADRIAAKLSEHGIVVGAVALTVQGLPVVRPYADETAFAGNLFQMKIAEVEFFEIADLDGDLGAIGWIAHHQYARSIPPTLGVGRIRARIGDVQIGEASVFDEIFKEPRFNGWCVGELHILDRRIVPNARRDNFELNHHTYNMMTQLGPKALELASRCRSSSVSRNVIVTARNCIDEIDRTVSCEAASPDGATLSKLRSSIERCVYRLKKLEVSIERDDCLDALKVRRRRLDDAPTTGPAVVEVSELTALVRKLVTHRDQANELIRSILAISSKHLSADE